MTGLDSFGSRARWTLGDDRYHVHRITAVPGAERLPVSLKIVLENLLRHEDGALVRAEHIAALIERRHDEAIDFHPSRAFLHDTNGVPVLTDLAALRDAVAAAGRDPDSVALRIPAELTVDHSVAADVSGRADAFRRNAELEYERNHERYRFLKWGSRAFDGLRVVPPGRGIMHQINVERLARVVERRDGWAFPDTCAGTDSHTTMVNGLGVLAWGIGGIEAEAALLGQPISMPIPPVVGVEFDGRLPAGTTATDLVLTVTEQLRAHGVVGSFVEFTGAGLATLPVAHRVTIANMAPEYGATAALFPVDELTLRYLRFTGRPAETVAAVETYCKEQGLWRGATGEPDFDRRVSIDLSAIEPVLAGPRRPQDRLPLRSVPASVPGAAPDPSGAGPDPSGAALADGAVAIAAITSCTNTSNPHAMVGAALLARNARRRGLSTRPWVKTSLAPGSRTVTDYLARAGLTGPLEELGFHLVGYGCTTCIGNSGPLLPDTAAAAQAGVRLAAVLSGNRNFDGRIHNDVSLAYLASPALVVAYALAGTVRTDLTTEPLGQDRDGRPVRLADIWPDDAEIDDLVETAVTPEMFTAAYADLFTGDELWEAVPAAPGRTFDWAPDSTYLRCPPFLRGVTQAPAEVADVRGARALLLLGDSVTTDHISPAGAIPASSRAADHLRAHGVDPRDFNTYASRRGNYEVMIRGGFSNRGLKNLLAPDAPGGHTPDATAGGAVVPVFDAAVNYQRAGVPLLVIAGAEYGTGSSRDWAAKATALLGVRAVLARSFERIHRSNLVQLGVLPLQFRDGDSAASLGLDGFEFFDIVGLAGATRAPGGTVQVRASREGGPPVEFEALVRLDTERELDYLRHGGILPFVLRSRLGG